MQWMRATDERIIYDIIVFQTLFKFYEQKCNEQFEKLIRNLISYLKLKTFDCAKGPHFATQM